MRLLVLNARYSEKGSVLETNAGVNLVVRDRVPAPAVVDVNLTRFWAYNNRVYAAAEVVSVKELSLEEVDHVV